MRYTCAGFWAGMAQWWERSPPTNVSRVRFPDPASYVGWVCCWFSSLLREVFLRVLRFSPLLKNQFFQNPIRSGIVKHFIMSLLLGWLRKHSLCLTLNLHLHFFFTSEIDTVGERDTFRVWPSCFFFTYLYVYFSWQKLIFCVDPQIAILLLKVKKLVRHC